MVDLVKGVSLLVILVSASYCRGSLAHRNDFDPSIRQIFLNLSFQHPYRSHCARYPYLYLINYLIDLINLPITNTMPFSPFYNYKTTLIICNYFSAQAERVKCTPLVILGCASRCRGSGHRNVA